MLVTIAVAAVGTLVCVGITGIFTKLRVEHKDEIIGLDAAEHGCVVFKNLAHFCYLKPLEIKSELCGLYKKQADFDRRGVSNKL